MNDAAAISMLRIIPTGANHTRITVFNQGAVAGHLTILKENAQAVFDALAAANGSAGPPTIEDFRPGAAPPQPEPDPVMQENAEPDPEPDDTPAEAETASEAAAQQADAAIEELGDEQPNVG